MGSHYSDLRNSFGSIQTSLNFRIWDEFVLKREKSVFCFVFFLVRREIGLCQQYLLYCLAVRKDGNQSICRDQFKTWVFSGFPSGKTIRGVFVVVFLVYFFSLLGLKMNFSWVMFWISISYQEMKSGVLRKSGFLGNQNTCFCLTLSQACQFYLCFYQVWIVKTSNSCIFHKNMQLRKGNLMIAPLMENI